MKVLVIIPAYNAARFISRTIDFIRNQSYKNIRIVVVDDASTDTTSAAVLRFPGIKLYMLPENVGTYMAVNYVLQKEKNFDAFYLLGADDCPHENMISSLVNPMIADPSVLMTFCGYKRMLYDTGEFTETRNGRHSSAALWRKSVYDTIGPFDNTRFGGDTEYWYRFLLYFTEKNIAQINKCLTNSIVHGNNLTVLVGNEKRLAYVKEFKERHLVLASQIAASKI